MYVDLPSLVKDIESGASLALPPDYSGCALAAVRALVRRQARRLHLIATPQLGMQGDLLIGAGCVTSIEAAAVTLGERGPAPRFAAAVSAGTLRIMDSTCPAIHAGLQAAEKGIPFMPLRGIIGSDVAAHRSDWRVMDNPYEREADPIVLLPAIAPDYALFHAPIADRDGNVWIGVRRELLLLAHAARRTLVTVEAVRTASLLEDPVYAAGTIPSLYLSALCEVPRGAWPQGVAGHYEADEEHLRLYADLARTEGGFAQYLDQYVHRDGPTSEGGQTRQRILA